MLSYLLSPRINLDPHALREPIRFFPSRVKGVYKFPERLEESLSTVDDFIIKHVQLAMNPLTVAFAKYCSDFYAVELIAFIPYLLLFIGYDAEVLPVLSQAIALLILSQLPKRFMWRYRPYMVSRAKIGSSDKTSSFPARTVGCGIVMTNMACIVLRNHWHPQGSYNLAVYYGLVTAWFTLVIILTSFCRIVLGAHYPSDCFVGMFQGLLSCFFGNVLHHFLSCPKELFLADVSRWNWDNIDCIHLLLWSGVGLVLILVFSSKPLELWTKSPLIAGILLPSVVFSKFLCPISVSDSHVVTLAPGQVFLQHFVILTCALGSIIFAYKYFKPRKLVHKAAYYVAVYSCLLVLLMLQRLESSVEEPPAMQ